MTKIIYVWHIVSCTTSVDPHWFSTYPIRELCILYVQMIRWAFPQSLELLRPHPSNTHACPAPSPTPAPVPALKFCTLTTSELNCLEKLSHNLYTVIMTIDLKLFKRKKIWQTIHIKIKSFLRSNGVFSRGTGSPGRDLKNRQGKEIGTNMSYSCRGRGRPLTKLSGSEAIKKNTKTPTSEKPVRTGQRKNWKSWGKGQDGLCPHLQHLTWLGG